MSDPTVRDCEREKGSKATVFYANSKFTLVSSRDVPASELKFRNAP